MTTIRFYLQFLLLIIYFLNGYPGVDGATCTTYSTCQTTDFTLSTCSSSKVCDCLNSSYVTIRSGCALKLDKPKINAMLGYSNQVVTANPFTLTCVVAGADLFEWYKDGTKQAETKLTYTDTASSTTVGSFTCKGLVQDIALVSDLSDAFKVEMLGGTGGLTTSSVQPTIYVPVTSVITGSSITLDCQNKPMSYTDKITYKVDGSDSAKTLAVDASNAGKTVTCEINNPSSGGYTFNTLTSASGKLPSVYDNIQSVTIKANGMAVTEVIGTSIQLTCSTSPQDPYLNSQTLTYTWLKDGSASGLPTTETYTPLESGTYSCTAQLGSLTKLTSVTVKVTIDNVLETSSLKPIKGGRVILTCGDIRTDGTTYTWTKGGKPIARQFDRRLQLDSFDTTDDGTYACQASGNQFYLSDTITLATQTSIDKPSIEQIGSILSSESFYEKGDYWLVCSTSSETIGMTYEWTFKGVASTTYTTKYYTLKDISSLNNGDYTCKAKFGTYSATSSTKTVTVIKPGLLCRHDNVCIAAKTGYTGKCDTNDRCTCSDGYWQEGELCTNGVLALMSSSITMAAILLFSKLF